MISSVYACTIISFDETSSSSVGNVQRITTLQHFLKDLLLKCLCEVRNPVLVKQKLYPRNTTKCRRMVSLYKGFIVTVN